jgi:putative transposase
MFTPSSVSTRARTGGRRGRGKPRSYEMSSAGSSQAARARSIKPEERLALPIWQRSYYDHVIRDEKDLKRTREYIDANPIRWALDPENV